MKTNSECLPVRSRERLLVRSRERGIGIVLVNDSEVVLANDSEVVLANDSEVVLTNDSEVVLANVCRRTFVLVRWKFALGPKVVSPFVFARGLASYMMAERATPLPFSPGNPGYQHSLQSLASWIIKSQ